MIIYRTINGLIVQIGSLVERFYLPIYMAVFPVVTVHDGRCFLRLAAITFHASSLKVGSLKHPLLFTKAVLLRLFY